ncbi:sulfite exporter TauE/SafE family protein [Kosmotoga pacifica]|uniref:Probable membrane transporter protein n=1 Tax=Kosmotoga pacifica TaxID=1330330 RepID=A0A0G2Z8X1_9BACT|nr:sulfite exporter TauE/SafE family protein [Kosmotoga pacifica]AKI98007.1 hypothetical protein IX53_09420 [Kosmotoga pacifica]
MNPILLVSVYFGGVLAGIVNTLAGGGSMITLPLLMLLGLPADIANATNRVAIFLQNAVAVRSFEKKGVRTFKIAIPLGLFAAAGAIVGSFIAVDLDKEVLGRVISVVLLIMMYFVVKKPKIGKNKAIVNSFYMKGIAFFLLGIYGGFIQAGIGFLLIAAITFFLGTDLLKTNAIKVGIVLIYTTTSLIVFLSKGMVNIPVGLLLALGNMTGAYIAVRLALKKGLKFIKLVLIVVVVANAIKTFFF